ncbi:hypothetical protein BDV33DRAFT_202352 [Aspergillus novoparasiticus]|uniref:Uncharacterized protein n=1 Tax=Aspergillus novoparasiticus TaxID=986946 RepID=A0A5N6EYF8_9EURO|nr:hypothetical protein BDV33DRAFT_202352 [Aspergillus novoparasiticus]
MRQLNESTDLLVPSTDDPSAYSIFAEEPRDSAGNCKVFGNPKLSTTDDDLPQAGNGLWKALGFQMSRRENVVELLLTPFGPSSLPLNADELGTLLADVADRRSQADSSDTAVDFDFREAGEIGSEFFGVNVDFRYFAY